MKLTKKTVLAIASFVLLLLQALGLKIDVPVVNEVISAAAGVLVMLGIVSDSSGDHTDGSPADDDSSGGGSEGVSGGEEPEESGGEGTGGGGSEEKTDNKAN